MKRSMRATLLLGSLLFCCFAGAAAAEPKADPAALSQARTAVDVATKQVLAVLSEKGLTTPERRTRIEAIAYENFDFRTMSKLVLRRDWKKFSEPQREQFVEEFKRHLSESYGSRLERYEQTGISIAGERAEARGDVTVMTVIKGGQFDGATVDYRMRKTKDRWLAIDVIIEGVSLVSNFHSQFAEIVNRDGPEGLLAQLREKNANSATPSAGE